MENKVKHVVKKNNIIDKISELYDSYEDDEYMTQKLENYIINQLPTILVNMKQAQQHRVNRIEELTQEQDAFIQSFLSNNQYFYVSTTNNFFMYDGLTYQIYSEDDILYNVLSTISKDRQLMSWKHKTKISIMKKIKNNNLLNSIPESETIQKILEIMTNIFFPSKEYAKYFLCVLGDSILKKNTHLIHFILNTMKEFLKHLNNLSLMLIGSQIGNTIKYKYYDHNYENFRIIHVKDSVKNEITWNEILKKHALDILCVSCYYSNRYTNSENYIIKHCNNDIIKNTIMIVKNTKEEDLVDEFIKEYIDETNVNNNIATINNSITSRSPQITWKNMQYLWKSFLHKKDIPSVIFMNQLKTLICDKLQNYYNNEQDIFIGICSKYLPSIQLFLNFWKDTIVFDENEYDFEIEELMVLFKQWCGTNNLQSNINDKQALDLIYYYYPNIEIEKDKYLSGIRCTLWDKQLDIQVAIENMKDQLQNDHYASNGESGTFYNVSIYDAYLYYCKFTTKKSNINLSNMLNKESQIVSKAYFEKYIFDNYSEYVIDNKFISSKWYLL